jgi:hypothetical protein
MTTTSATLRGLDNANFRTSRRADTANEFLRTRLGLHHRYEPARLAIGRSLAIAAPIEPISDEFADEDGKSILGKTLFGDEDLAIWASLIAEYSNLSAPTVETLQEHVRRHWHRGALLLEAEWKSHEERFGEDEVYERFIVFLAERAGIPSYGSGEDQAIKPGREETRFRGAIELRLGEPGTDVNTGEVVYWTLNGKGSPHVAIMGGTGSGKTRLATSMLRQVQQNNEVPCIVFDFKGDLCTNQELVQVLNATVVSSPATPIPLDVLHVSIHSDHELTNAAVRFRDSFSLIPGRGGVGAVQGGAIRDAAKAALVKSTAERPADLYKIRDELNDHYTAAGKKPDTLSETLQELTQWKLFEPRLIPKDFFSRSWIIDVHNATETAQRLVVFLILDAMYSHFRTLTDSAIDSQGNRSLRCILVVDEARRVLGYGQRSLVGMVRESRSKGLSVFLISQSPDDYDTPDEDFLEQIGLTVSFKSNGQSARVLRSCFGQTIDLAALGEGIGITRLPGQSKLTRVRAWQ